MQENLQKDPYKIKNDLIDYIHTCFLKKYYEISFLIIPSEKAKEYFSEEVFEALPLISITDPMIKYEKVKIDDVVAIERTYERNVASYFYYRRVT